MVNSPYPQPKQTVQKANLFSTISQLNIILDHDGVHSKLHSNAFLRAYGMQWSKPQRVCAKVSTVANKVVPKKREF